MIELDDANHEAGERMAADAKKDRALAAAGLPIIRWQAKSLPDIATIRSAIGHSRPRQAASARPVATAA